jgi:branched-chain amino acid transport system substrate-binding protein
MHNISRRRFLKVTAATGAALALGDLADLPRLTGSRRVAYASEPIKIGIIDPLSGPYNTSSIHDVHGATVAVERFNKSGGVLDGR